MYITLHIKYYLLLFSTKVMCPRQPQHISIYKYYYSENELCICSTYSFLVAKAYFLRLNWVDVRLLSVAMVPALKHTNFKLILLWNKMKP